MVQQIINSISGMTLEKGKGDKETMKKYSKEIDSVSVEMLGQKAHMLKRIRLRSRDPRISDPSHEASVFKVMLTLVKTVNSRVISGIGRDAILEMITKNADYQALDWGLKLVENDGLYRLMDVASELPEVHYESSMEVTSETKPKVSVCLDRLWYCMDHDAAKEQFRKKANDFIDEKLRTGDELEPKVGTASRPSFRCWNCCFH